jgi:hypothetical protein
MENTMNSGITSEIAGAVTGMAWVPGDRAKRQEAAERAPALSPDTSQESRAAALVALDCRCVNGGR